MKMIRVVAAVICDSIQTKHRIYATARGYGDYKGQWEFPGGKIEPGETPQQALKREIEEELDTEIAVHDKIGTIEYNYPTFHLSMDCFWCVVLSGNLILKEAEAARWLTKDELDSVQWLPDWMEFEQQRPIQTQHIYLSLGDKEEHTKSAVMAVVGDNIRTLHSQLIARGADCTFEWNSGGHFKDADLRTARAFRWVMEESR